MYGVAGVRGVRGLGFRSFRTFFWLWGVQGSGLLGMRQRCSGFGVGVLGRVTSGKYGLLEGEPSRTKEGTLTPKPSTLNPEALNPKA